jgi:hypothetical protein
MTTYLSSRDAKLKYGVSVAKLVRHGRIRRIRVGSVPYKSGRAGPPVRWVYDENEIQAYAGTAPKTSQVVSRNQERQALEMFAQGENVIDVVFQTKLPLQQARDLRDAYNRETGGLYLPPHVVARILDLRFELPKPESVAEIIERLSKRLRQETEWRFAAEKANGVRVSPKSTIEVVPDNDPFDEPSSR